MADYSRIYGEFNSLAEARKQYPDAFQFKRDKDGQAYVLVAENPLE